MCQFWNMFNARCLGLHDSAFHNILENKGFLAIASAIFVGQILIIQLGGNAFRTTPLSVSEWIVVTVGTSAVLWIGEIWRWLKRSGKLDASRAA